MKARELKAHCDRLCAEHEITWLPGRLPLALRVTREILTPPIRGPVSYAWVLHEIGHILGRYQNSRRCMVRETWAWTWARHHTLCWTPAMERSRQAGLDWYRARAAGIDAKWQPEVVP